MTAKTRYLICAVGCHAIAIPSAAVRRIWKTGDAPLDASGALDLRKTLRAANSGEGAIIALEESGSLLVVDEVKGMTVISESAFFSLPPAFKFATQFFDAACREPIDGRHALRLRLQPLSADAPECSPL